MLSRSFSGPSRRESANSIPESASPRATHQKLEFKWQGAEARILLIVSVSNDLGNNRDGLHVHSLKGGCQADAAATWHPHPEAVLAALTGDGVNARVSGQELGCHGLPVPRSDTGIVR
jgi:hypothetical protein